MVDSINTVVGVSDSLKTTTGIANQTVIVLGYHEINDGGGGTFIWDPSSSLGDNTGTIIVPTGSTTGRWLRIYDETINVKWFGAKGDGSADDSVPIITALNTLEEKGTLFFPASVYYTTQTIKFGNGNEKFDVTIDLGNSKIISKNSFVAFSFSGVELGEDLTVTEDYIYPSSRNSITVNNTTGIQPGYLLNIVSSELYDTSRAYYFKGGNAIVKKVDGNKIYFDLNFPFNLKADTIVAKVFRPIKITVKNGSIEGYNKTQSAFLARGIQISYGTDIALTNVHVSYFRRNIEFTRCVEGEMSNCTTGRAKFSDTDNWDGYGITISSSSFISIRNCRTVSGQHGITTTGWEVNFGIRIRDCVLDDDIWGLSLGLHENIWDCEVENCYLFGAWFSGNVKISNCEFVYSENPRSSVLLACAEQSANANYIFTGCNFNSIGISLRDYYQQVCPTRKYVGKISIENSMDFMLSTDVRRLSADSQNQKTAEVGCISVSDSKFNEIRLYDNHRMLNVTNSYSESTYVIRNPAIPNYEELGSGSIDQVNIFNLKIPYRYRNIHLVNCKKVIIENLSYSEIDFRNPASSYDEVYIAGAQEINLNLVDLTGSNGGLSIAASVVTDLRISKSKIHFRKEDTFRNLLTNSNVSNFNGNAFTNLNDGKTYNIQNKLLRTTGAATPTSLIWGVGDLIYNTSVNANSPKGWICVAAGTPGTWVEI